MLKFAVHKKNKKPPDVIKTGDVTDGSDVTDIPPDVATNISEEPVLTELRTKGPLPVIPEDVDCDTTEDNLNNKEFSKATDTSKLSELADIIAYENATNEARRASQDESESETHVIAECPDVAKGVSNAPREVNNSPDVVTNAEIRAPAQSDITSQVDIYAGKGKFL